MSQGLRDMLANRKFAIPLIILLAFCLIGLILVGVVLILRPGAPDSGTPVAQTTFTPTLEPTQRPIPTSIPTDTPAPRATPTLVPLGTLVTSVTTGTAVAPAGGTTTPVFGCIPDYKYDFITPYCRNTNRSGHHSNQEGDNNHDRQRDRPTNYIGDGKTHRVPPDGTR